MSTSTWPCGRASSSSASTVPGADLGPPVRARQPGDHGQPRVDAALHRGEPLLQRAGAGEPGRRQQPRDLVEDPEHLGHAAAVRVGVDQDRAGLAPGQLGGQPGGDRGAAGCAGRSPDDDDATAGRARGASSTRRASGLRAAGWWLGRDDRLRQRDRGRRRRRRCGPRSGRPGSVPASTGRRRARPPPAARRPGAAGPRPPGRARARPDPAPRRRPGRRWRSRAGRRRRRTA